MATLLQINSSLFSADGQSSMLANRFVEQWRQTNPGGQVVVRDLANNPLPHLNAERFQAFLANPNQRNLVQQAHVAASDELIEELVSADILVLALPMYNFGIPSTLKAWIDHIARAGRTFKYTEQGSVGLLQDRKVVVFAARGGRYQGTPKDTQSTYIKDVLNFIGLQDIEFVYAEGLAMGEDSRHASLQAANKTIKQLAKQLELFAA